MTKIALEIVQGIKDTEVHVVCSKQTSEVMELYDTINHAINYDSIELPCFDGYDIVCVPLNVITHFFTMDKKVFVEYKNQNLEVKKRLYEIEDFLREKNLKIFIRVSKNSIVNFDYVERLNMKLTGSIFIILKSGTKVAISRRYYSKIKDFLNRAIKNMEIER